MKKNQISELLRAPSLSDPVHRYETVYWTECGESGKMTRSIELFREKPDMIVQTATHRLATEMKSREVNSCTYHSLFRYKGDACTPDRIYDKYIPKSLFGMRYAPCR